MTILAVFSPRRWFASPCTIRRERVTAAGCLVHSERVLLSDVSQLSAFADSALVDIERSISRGGWFGPAHDAYALVLGRFRERLIGVIVRIHALG